MRFRFVIDHRQLVGLIAGVLLLSLLSFLGGLSVGLLVQPVETTAPVAPAVALDGPTDPELERDTALGQIVIPAPSEGTLGAMPGVDERRAAEMLRAESLAYGGGDGFDDGSTTTRSHGIEESRPVARRAEASSQGAASSRSEGWTPRSSHWRTFADRVDGGGGAGGGPVVGDSRWSTPRMGLRLGFREGQAPPRVRFGEAIYRVARDHDLNPALMAAMARVESNFDPSAVSHRGARGLMQVTPDTARRFGVEPDTLEDPERNLVASARYLVWLRERYEGDPRLILAAYNAGEAAVDSYGGIPDYPETQNYVERVLGFLGVPR